MDVVLIAQILKFACRIAAVTIKNKDSMLLF
jgi:hypothetical protein